MLCPFYIHYITLPDKPASLSFTSIFLSLSYASISPQEVHYLLILLKCTIVVVYISLGQPAPASPLSQSPPYIFPHPRNSLLIFPSTTTDDNDDSDERRRRHQHDTLDLIQFFFPSFFLFFLSLSASIWLALSHSLSHCHYLSLVCFHSTLHFDFVSPTCPSFFSFSLSRTAS